VTGTVSCVAPALVTMGLVASVTVACVFWSIFFWFNVQCSFKK
jgi:tetrahydromethanopterin S-methyltransferase subunit C